MTTRTTSAKARLLSCTAGALLLAASAPAQACAGDPMLGSICVVTYNFCPRGFAQAAGQILPIIQNNALFSLLGTTYGGDGRITFALPDLRARVPVGDGQGLGLSSIALGERAGSEAVTLTTNQMPAHTHGAQLRASSGNGGTDSPANAVSAKQARTNVYSSGAADINMGASAITVATAGNGHPVPIRNPYLGLRYCIALEGIFPPQE